jgi:hypothetical protein
LTGRNAPDGEFQRQLGILLDNELLSAPSIQERIHEHGRITGKFTREEVDFLVNILEAGSLPVLLDRDPMVDEFFAPDPRALHTMQVALASGLAVLLVAGCLMTIRWRWLGTAAALAGLIQFLLSVTLLELIRASFTVSLVGMLIAISLLVTAANAIVCRSVIRGRASTVLATAAAIHLLFLLSCAAAVAIYGLGDPTSRRTATGLLAAGITALVTQGCLWSIPAFLAQLRSAW